MGMVWWRRKVLVLLTGICSPLFVSCAGSDATSTSETEQRSSETTVNSEPSAEQILRARQAVFETYFGMDPQVVQNLKGNLERRNLWPSDFGSQLKALLAVRSKADFDLGIQRWMLVEFENQWGKVPTFPDGSLNAELGSWRAEFQKRSTKNLTEIDLVDTIGLIIEELPLVYGDFSRSYFETVAQIGSPEGIAFIDAPGKRGPLYGLGEMFFSADDGSASRYFSELENSIAANVVVPQFASIVASMGYGFTTAQPVSALRDGYLALDRIDQERFISVLATGNLDSFGGSISSFLAEFGFNPITYDSGRIDVSDYLFENPERHPAYAAYLNESTSAPKDVSTTAPVTSKEPQPDQSDGISQSYSMPGDSPQLDKIYLDSLRSVISPGYLNALTDVQLLNMASMWCASFDEPDGFSKIKAFILESIEKGWGARNDSLLYVLSATGSTTLYCPKYSELYQSWLKSDGVLQRIDNLRP